MQCPSVTGMQCPCVTGMQCPFVAGIQCPSGTAMQFPVTGIQCLSVMHVEKDAVSLCDAFREGCSVLL